MHSEKQGAAFTELAVAERMMARISTCLFIALLAAGFPCCKKTQSVEGDSQKKVADKRVLKKAADHFNTKPENFEAYLECQAESGDGALFEVRRADAKDSGMGSIIRHDGKLFGWWDEDHGPDLAFKACNIIEKLPDEAELAARIYLFSAGEKAEDETLVTKPEPSARSQAGAGLHPPAVSIIDGGWNLTFWTHALKGKKYKHYKVFVLRPSSVELNKVDEFPYGEAQ